MQKNILFVRQRTLFVTQTYTYRKICQVIWLEPEWHGYCRNKALR